MFSFFKNHFIKITIMFIIFKKRGEDDNLLSRVDEDEIEDDYIPNLETNEDNTENFDLSR